MKSLQSNRGKRPCDSEAEGGLYIERPEKFRRKLIDRITRYRPECGERLELNPDEWGVEPGSQIKFKAVRGRKQLRRAAKQDVDFIYNETRGGLFFNSNGSDRGWGEGGLFAMFKNKPDLGSEHFEFVVNDSEFN